MQLQANFILRQLKQLLKRRKYKFVINRVQKIVQKDEDLALFSNDFLFSILYQQSSAVNKLFARNLLKKYKYHPHLIESLLNLLLRNLSQCHDILKQEIRENTIFQMGEKTGSDTNFCLGSRENSFADKCSINSIRIRNNSIKLSNGLQISYKIKTHLKLFLKLINESSLYFLLMMTVYKKDINIQYIQEFIENMRQLTFKNISNLLSVVKLQLYYGKILSQGNTKEEFSKSEQIISVVVQNLLDILHMINIASAKIINSKAKQNKIRKYEQLYRQCYKMLVISVIINNKNQMKLLKQNIATLGVQIFKATLQNLTSKYGFFKKLIIPELYLQQQFLKYRVQKQELIEIISIYFNQKTLQMEDHNRQKLLIDNTILDYYNKKIKVHVQRTNNKPKTIYSQINTVKSIGTTLKKKATNVINLPKNIKQERNSSDYKSSIISKMIISQIDQINNNYLKFKQINSKSLKVNKKQKNKSLFYKIQTTGNLKKQRLSQNKTKIECEQKQQCLMQNKQILAIEQNQYRTKINTSKERLARKYRQKILHVVQNQEREGCLTQQIKNIQDTDIILQNYRYSEEKSIQIQQKDIKRNMLTITAKKKTELFIQILFQNRDSLGLKKIAQKFQSLKKKQQQKIKMMSNRLTSSINRDRQRNSIVRFQVIAKQILKRHISFQVDKINSQQKTSLQMAHRKKLIDASFVLGQRSIETVKQKLQSKMNKSENVVDKYLKNQQMFKLKLKKLGTTNFILKKQSERLDITIEGNNSHY